MFLKTRHGEPSFGPPHIYVSSPISEKKTLALPPERKEALRAPPGPPRGSAPPGGRRSHRIQLPIVRKTGLFVLTPRPDPRPGPPSPSKSTIPAALGKPTRPLFHLPFPSLKFFFPVSFGGQQPPVPPPCALLCAQPPPRRTSVQTGARILPSGEFLKIPPSFSPSAPPSFFSGGRSPKKLPSNPPPSSPSGDPMVRENFHAPHCLEAPSPWGFRPPGTRGSCPRKNTPGRPRENWSTLDAKWRSQS